ncbi:hypothetical protein L3X38_026825 [Prunus dulcis]|uniref:Tf2-1-like SH3-like domain-containing protein n=1 Tax=Prunus dulcis TaxID=3755 RepID=A0AAD4YZU5_PRUDU|nr:hypothetical protein L3X38_026825 [Prunus dulcis]
MVKLFVDEIVRLHGAPASIVSGRDARFTSRRLWVLSYVLLKDNWDTHLALVEFAYNNSYHLSIEMAPYEALNERQCRTPICWNEMGDKKVEKVDSIRATTEKFSPWKGVMRFGKHGTLSPCYIGPCEITERIGPVAYRLALPTELSRIHDVSHVSMLRKYMPDPSHVLEHQPVELREDLMYEEQSVQILDRNEQRLRSRSIPVVKVLWRSQTVEEATWEPEEQMRAKYPYLFH